MKQKIQTILNELNHGLVERENTIKIALLTMLAGENLVIIGPPGTGKSLIARRIAESLDHSSDDSAGYFEYLLTKFSTPEEIFGPLSITELKADRFKRNTAGYLPSVKVAFLDEIFKASSSILNALLTILNERIYHNGSEPQAVPLQALIAASNELPTGQEELNALYDRFLVRSFVDYVKDENLLHLFAHTEKSPQQTLITLAELSQIKNAAQAVVIPREIAEAIQSIWVGHKQAFKEDSREVLSDRRLKKVLHLLRVSALTNGRNTVDLSDVLLMKDCLWNHQDNVQKVRELIFNTLQRHSRQAAKSSDVTVPALRNDVPVYEVAEDGVTLIAVSEKSTAMTTKSSALVARTQVQLRVEVKGFKGDGTEQAPLIIRTVEDLMDLGRPDVGLKGYYFKQTADIDCSAITHWPKISFQGHYHGAGHTITHGEELYIFSDIAQSSITDLRLEILGIAAEAAESIITKCATDVNLIGEADSCTITACQADGELIAASASNCTITACQAEGALIGGGASGSTITACQTGQSLIGGTASNCTIADCLAVSDFYGADSKICAFISVNIMDGSLVERCYVEGKGTYTGSGLLNTSGCFILFAIVQNCNASTIRQCASGVISKNSSYVNLSRLVGAVVNNSVLENNASIDSNIGEDKINGRDGKTVAAALFKQRYFEHTLGWDFDTMWQWDDQKNHPVLRSVGVGATVVKSAAKSAAKSADPQAATEDLLVQQLRANIWL